MESYEFETSESIELGLLEKIEPLGNRIFLLFDLYGVYLSTVDLLEN